MPDLGVGVVARNSAVEVALGDRVGSGFHLRERAQADAHQPPAERGGGDQRGGRDRDLDPEQPLQRRGGVIERYRDEELPARRKGRRPNAELRPAALHGSDREERVLLAVEVDVIGDIRRVLVPTGKAREC